MATQRRDASGRFLPKDPSVKHLAPKGAPPKSPGHKVVSKAQQRFAFAAKMPWAHEAARHGAAFKRLPDHKRKR
jgi:hypothetical protein